jgi:hypothetical protein
MAYCPKSPPSVCSLRPNTSRGSLIVIQQPTEPRTPTDPALASARRAPVDKPILESLVIPLAMVVIDEFLEGASKVALAEGHHPIEALELWRADASITAGVYITERRWRLGLRPSSCGTLL